MSSYRVLCLALVMLLLPSMLYAKAADGPKSLGSFGGWTAYSATEAGKKFCYMVTRVKGVSTKKFKRNDGSLMITERPDENSRDVVSFSGGYNFKPVSDVTIKIGRDEFGLFTQKDTAWSRDSATDRQITALIRKNDTLTATGMPAAKGAVAVTDKIDLKGAAPAYASIAKACGLPVPDAPKAAPKPKSAKASHP